MTCRCEEAADRALAAKRTPQFADAFQTEDVPAEKAFLAGLRTGLLWAGQRAVNGNYVTLGQRISGVASRSMLVGWADQVRQDIELLEKRQGRNPRRTTKKGTTGDDHDSVG